MTKPRIEDNNTPTKTTPMDSTLRLASKLDRLIGKMDPKMRKWAIAFLTSKYLDDMPIYACLPSPPRDET